VTASGHVGLTFTVNGRTREVLVAASEAEVYGLVELVDNNPLVCAEVASVPSAAGTLALIALGPLASAGILVEPPTFLVSIPAVETDIQAALATEHWQQGATVHVEVKDLDGVAAATAMAVIATPDDLSEIDDLYEERFARSFFVEREEHLPWDPALVRQTPRAVYKLAITPDAPHSLMTINVMADLEGKCGACQIVHAMNVMCGFEEGLGIRAWVAGP
jgi:N-acetyl-gamma-glutamylphosphate reductase